MPPQSKSLPSCSQSLSALRMSCPVGGFGGDVGKQPGAQMQQKLQAVLFVFLFPLIWAKFLFLFSHWREVELDREPGL